MFVFRIAKGHGGGNPQGSCPLDYSHIKFEITNLKKSEIEKNQINYEDKRYLDFLHKELWSNHILRQGWGLEGLDLNAINDNEKDDFMEFAKRWIGNYMLNGKKFWNEDIDCKSAKGRFNVIKKLKDFQCDDIVFIPKTSHSLIDDNDKFVVCRVQKPYKFDLPKSVIMDFGHCIFVKDLREFAYKDCEINPNDFCAPYMFAVSCIKENHKRYEKFKNFINKTYISHLKQE